MSEMINLLLFLSVTALHFLPTLTISPHNITAVFAFGDGFYDSGNNNNIRSICNANHKPYGVNFPRNAPTGRFSDGELPGDLVVKHLGLKKFLRSFSDIGVSDEEFLTGVSFASACSGLREATAVQTKVLGLPNQFGMFVEAINNKIKMAVGKEIAAKTIQGGLYLIASGTHDFLNNYYNIVPKPARNAYVVMLQLELETHIKRLHSMGAMKFAVAGIPPIGCLPLHKTFHGGIQNWISRKCMEDDNRDAEAYNEMLQHRLQDLQHNLLGTRIIYIDIYRPMLDMIINPDKFNMEVAHKGCCATGFFEFGTTCSFISMICNAPSRYVFWDAIHPTESAYKIIMHRFLDNELHHLLF